MSLSLRLDLSIPQTVEEGGTTKYVISLGKEGTNTRWTVKKRYSELEIFYQFLRKESVPIGAEFPKKGFGGKLPASKIEERRLMLEIYLQELVGLVGFSTTVKSEIFKFLDIPAEDTESNSAQTEGFGENKTRSPLRSASTSPQRTTFFNKPVGSGETSTRGKPIKTYPLDGDGIRDAIKCRDKYGVQDILEKDESLVSYIDGHGDSMLHLACIFNETDIAMMLVEKGAEIKIQNGMGETTMDVCQPTLKKKILARRKKLGFD